MSKVTVGPIGTNLSAASNTALFGLGEQALTDDGKALVYVKAGGSDLAANATLQVSTSFAATANTTTLNGTFKTSIAIPADNYAWVYKLDTKLT